MEKKYFISIENAKKYKAYDSIGLWLFDLEKERKELKENNHGRNNEIITLQNKILKELPFERLAWLAILFSKLEKKEHKNLSDLSIRVKNAVNTKWGNKIAEIKED